MLFRPDHSRSGRFSLPAALPFPATTALLASPASPAPPAPPALLASPASPPAPAPSRGFAYRSSRDTALPNDLKVLKVSASRSSSFLFLPLPSSSLLFPPLPALSPAPSLSLFFAPPLPCPAFPVLPALFPLRHSYSFFRFLRSAVPCGLCFPLLPVPSLPVRSARSAVPCGLCFPLPTVASLFACSL